MGSAPTTAQRIQDVVQTNFGKRLLAPCWKATAFGGWQVQPIYQYQSGPPLGFGNAIFRGNLKDVPLSSSEAPLTAGST